MLNGKQLKRLVSKIPDDAMIGHIVIRLRSQKGRISTSLVGSLTKEFLRTSYVYLL
jgi:hypothetical protein